MAVENKLLPDGDPMKWLCQHSRPVETSPRDWKRGPDKFAHWEKAARAVLITAVQNLTWLNLRPAAPHDVPSSAPLSRRSTWQVAHTVSGACGWLPRRSILTESELHVHGGGGVSRCQHQEHCGAKSWEWVTESGRAGGGGKGRKEERRQCRDEEMKLFQEKEKWPAANRQSIDELCSTRV